jgi:phosphoribosyl 1,2-cyclic phosphodiesterase
VRCWGARGSVPVSGAEFVRYGGDTSCVEVRSEAGELLVLDAGTGIRRLGMELAAADRPVEMTLLFSHFHWDHLQGLPFFRPLYQAEARIAIAGFGGRRGEGMRALGRALRPPLFPVPFESAPAQISQASFKSGALRLGGMLVRRIPLSHPNQGFGFRIEADGASLVYLTDNELSLRHKGGLEFADYVDFCRGADLLIHDAEYTPEEYPRHRGWGHSHYADAARLAAQAQVGALGLFHHNQERSDDALDAIVARCGELLAVSGGPVCEAIGVGFERKLGG